MANAASVIVQLMADTTDFERKLGGAQNRLTTLGSKVSGVGTALTAGVTVPLVGLGVAAAKTAADFESQMNILSVAARDSGLSLEELSEAALAVGGDTRLVGVNAADAADTLTGLYKAGLSTTAIFGDLTGYLHEGAELSGALRAAIDLAAASELDMAAAGELVAVVMSTYGLEAADAVRITDSLVQSADASVASVSDLAEGLATVGPLAVSMGMSLEDTNTALALLSERGVSGAEAGTQLKSMLLNITRPTQQVTETWEGLGISLYTAEGNFKSLDQIMGETSAALAGMTEEQRHQTVATLAGAYGQNAFNILLQEGTDGWTAMEGAITSAASAQEVARARTQGFHGALEQLKSVIETFLIRAGQPLLENVVTPLVRRLTDLAAVAANADPRLISLGVTLAGAAAAAGPVLFVVGKLISLGGTLAAGLVKLKGALLAGKAALAGLSLAGGPVVWAIVGIVAAVAALVYAWQHDFAGVREVVVRVFGAISRVIRAFLDTVRPVLEAFLAHIRQVFAEHGPPLLAAFGELWETLRPLVTTALSILGAALTGFLGLFTGVVSGLLQGLGALMEMFTRVLTHIIGIISGIVKVVSGLFEVLIGLLSGDGERVRAGFARMGAGVAQIFTHLVEGVVALFTGLWATLKGLAEGIWKGIVGFFTNLYQDLVGGSIVPDLVNGILTWFTTLLSRATEIFSGLLQRALEIWTGIRETITTKVTEVWTQVTGKVNEIATHWGTKWSEIRTTLQTRWEEMRANVAAKAEEVASTLRTRLTETASNWATRWSEMKQNAATRLGEILTTVGSKAQEIRDKFFSVDWAAVGSGIINAVRDGIMAVAGALASAAASVVQNAINAARAVFGGAGETSRYDSGGSSGSGAIGGSGGGGGRGGVGGNQNVVINTNAGRVSVSSKSGTHRAWVS